MRPAAAAARNRQRVHVRHTALGARRTPARTVLPDSFSFQYASKTPPSCSS
jgi:hypothetical protein